MTQLRILYLRRLLAEFKIEIHSGVSLKIRHFSFTFLLALIAISSVAQANGWTLWLQSDFDTWPISYEALTEIGSADSLTGMWHYVSSDPPFPVVEGPEFHSGSGNAIRLSRFGPGGGDNAFYGFRDNNVTKGKVRCTFSIYSKILDCVLYVALTDSNNISSRQVGLKIKPETGIVSYYDKKKVTLTSDMWEETSSKILSRQWTSVRIELDLDKKEYAVYVPHDTNTAIIENIKVADDYAPNAIWFFAGDRPGRWWIDDVKMELSDPPSQTQPISDMLKLRLRDDPHPKAETQLPRIFSRENPKNEIPEIDQIQKGLFDWAKSYPNRISVETVGMSAEGRPVILCNVTDKKIPSDNKQRVLITTSHGNEVNTTCQVLNLIKWLLSDDSLASKVRQNQEILLMPCNHPDAYMQRENIRDFTEHLNWSGISEPGKYPEGVVYFEILRKYNPEVHIDLRSVDDTKGVIMGESVGVCFDSATARPFNLDVLHEMRVLASKGGFHCWGGEGGNGKVMASCPIPGANEHYYQRLHKITPTNISYNSCHSLSFEIHTSFQESFLLAFKGLLEIGNTVFNGEYYAGYPVNQIARANATGVAAWGTTASQRRASRIELWQKMGNISSMQVMAERQGYQIAMVSTDPTLTRRLLRNSNTSWPDFIENLRKEPDAKRFYFIAMEQLYEEGWANGIVYNLGGNYDPTPDCTIYNGMNIRLHLPFDNVSVKQLLLDGHPIKQSLADGYTLHHNPGTIVDVAIPPGKVKAVHIVSIAYDYEPRRAGWEKEDWELEK